MKPPDYSRSLYFTPRPPWGRRPQKRPGQSANYLRASENDTEAAKGLYIKPEFDDKNPEGKTALNFDLGVGVPFRGEVKQEADDALNRKNNAWIRAQAAKVDQAAAAKAAAAKAAQQPQNGASGAAAGKTHLPCRLKK